MGGGGELHCDMTMFLKNLISSKAWLPCSVDKLACFSCFSLQYPSVSEKNTQKDFHNFDILKIFISCSAYYTV